MAAVRHAMKTDEMKIGQTNPASVRALAILAIVFCILGSAQAGESVEIPTGQTITPDAASGAIFQDLDPGHPEAPDMRAGQAAAEAVSADGRMLAILTSGYNVYFGADGKPVPELSTEYVFLFDITGPAPKQVQVLPLQNTFEGLAWAPPSSDRLYVAGGSDDSVHEFVRSGAKFDSRRVIRLGHDACVGLNLPSTPKYWTAPTTNPVTRRCAPVVASLAVSPDGTRLLAANFQNDSVSLVDLASGRVVAEQDLRPGAIDPKDHGRPGGSFPRSVAWSAPDRAYVASERDREIISLRVSGDRMRVKHRVAVRGQPMAVIANRAGTRVYAALDTSSRVAVIDTASDKRVETFDVTAPEEVFDNKGILGGANTDALALTPDENTLLVSNGGQNAIAVVHLSDRARGVADGRPKAGDDDERGPDRSAVMGLVPTGRYPTGVATSKDGATWYVVNFKSDTGPNVIRCPKKDSAARNCLPDSWVARTGDTKNIFDDSRAIVAAQNRQEMRLEKAGFLTLPAPSALELARLTKLVAHNNHFDEPETAAADAKLFAFLHAHIKHVVYIVKENKTYDEMLGDLEIGNGDPSLTFFPNAYTPNHHALARNFVTLDNFVVTGMGSWTGWDWSVSAQTNDFRERSEMLASASNAFRSEGGMEGEPGLSRNLNMAYATSAERHANNPLSPTDPDILPGARDVSTPDGPGAKEGKGFIWVAAQERGLTVRNWGFLGGFFRSFDIPFLHDPHAEKRRVYFPTRASLMPISDPYYYSFDPAFPDFWRVREWQREFAQFCASKSAPDLMLIHLTNDHTGDFLHGIDGVDTVDTQVADNDYALGEIIETVANSPFAGSTLIITIEDDPLSGLDHVDAFRSIALFAGPYVRQHALVSKRYTTVSVIKTIEDILGFGPMGLNDALAAPMSEVFDPSVTSWSYKAIVPSVLRSTKLPLPPDDHASVTRPRHSAKYWARAMAGQDFSEPDRIEPVAFTHALWRGLKGNTPYPVARIAKNAGK